MSDTHRQKGFTIVELLIVIVVIGILGAIVIVAFNGIQNQAAEAKVTSTLSQYSRKIQAYQATNSRFPTDITEAGVTDEDDIAYQYVSTGLDNFCLMATYKGTSYFVNQGNTKAEAGVCGGYNMTTWNKASGTAPVSGVVVDTSTFRTSTASMRIGPNTTGRAILGGPFTGSVGQTYTVSLWVRSDPTWNGTSDNSKIRFGNGSNGALITACGYGGVKATWTQVTCSYTLDASNTSVGISVGNNGTVGNIWIDDLSVSRS